MKKGSKLKLRFFALSLGFGLGIWAPTAFAALDFSTQSQVKIQADVIEYRKDQGLVLARGQVHIQQDKVHLYADKIRYDTAAQDIQADGHVVWQDQTQEVEAQSLTYNLRTKEGKAFHIKTTSPPWVSTGEEVDIKGDKVVIHGGVITTCDYPVGYQHYYLKSDKITLYSGNFLVAENVVLYIGKVPVFYFPFFVKTIHDLRTPFSISTGSTDYLGSYLLLTTNYLFSPVNYGALYTDYFTKKSFGIGVRHEIALNPFSTLSLYGYVVPEKDTGRFRWESRIRGLWAFSSSLQGRVEADIPGDGLFSQDYSVARRDPSLVSTAREYDISATYSKPQYSLSLLLRRQETADINNSLQDTFIRTLQNLPQVSFSLFPQSLFGRGSWLKYDLSLQGDHTYTQANNFYVDHLSGEVGLGGTFLPLKSQTLFTRVAFDEKYQDVSDAVPTPVEGVTVTDLGGQGETHSANLTDTWTARWSEFCSSTFSHIFSQKLNHILSTDPPHGILANLVTGSLDLTSGTVFRARTSTSFDFNAQVGTEGARFSYLRQELYLTPSALVNGVFIADYSIQADALKDFNAVLNFQNVKDLWRFRLSGNFVDPNVSNTGLLETGSAVTTLGGQTLTVGGEVDFALFTNYRVTALETYDLTHAKFESRSVSLYRDLHDWEAELNYTEDPVNGREFYFKLNLKAFPGKPLSVSEDELQQINATRNQGLTGSADQFQ